MTQGEISKDLSVSKRKLKKEKKWFHFEPFNTLLLENQD